jgi:ABC-type sugar transport system ATPase subunit
MNILEVKNISKTFGLECTQRCIFNSGKDKTLSLLRASGSGKSTLLKLLLVLKTR